MDSLGDRMKEYEAVPKLKLIRRMPAILRLDGRAFHTFTAGMEKPFDDAFMRMMKSTTVGLMGDIQTSVLAYVQSDEISILLKDYTKLETQAWFGGQIQKIVSIGAACATKRFNVALQESIYFGDRSQQVFDARVFNIPKEDVCNYFIWRQKDATRNSINALGQAHFSHKELQGKSQNDVLDMLHAKGINWNETPTVYKRGFCVFRITAGDDSEETLGISPDLEIPIFTEDRNYVESFL